MFFSHRICEREKGKKWQKEKNDELDAATCFMHNVTVLLNGHFQTGRATVGKIKNGPTRSAVIYSGAEFGG